jgi:pimeloyl-ACP methyl ester carboxylesterase
VKATFRDPRSLSAALGYYRALRPWPPPSHRMKISVPTVCFAGETDIMPPPVYERARSRFTGPYEVERMPGGHFMHREHPVLFNEKLLRVLERTRNT